MYKKLNLKEFFELKKEYAEKGISRNKSTLRELFPYSTYDLEGYILFCKKLVEEESLRCSPKSRMDINLIESLEELHQNLEEYRETALDLLDDLMRSNYTEDRNGFNIAFEYLNIENNLYTPSWSKVFIEACEFSKNICQYELYEVDDNLFIKVIPQTNENAPIQYWHQTCCSKEEILKGFDEKNSYHFANSFMEDADITAGFEFDVFTQNYIEKKAAKEVAHLLNARGCMKVLRAELDSAVTRLYVKDTLVYRTTLYKDSKEVFEVIVPKETVYSGSENDTNENADNLRTELLIVAHILADDNRYSLLNILSNYRKKALDL